MTIHIPNIDPVIFKIGPLSINYYSLSYIIGIILAWKLINKIITQFNIRGINKKNIEDFMNIGTIGMILGGRLGYIMFYNPIYYLSNISEVFKIYKGGMSFHGGMLGIIIACYYFTKKNRIQFFTLTDILATVSPIGLFFGRIANFINSELYGRQTNAIWGVIFPNDNQVRHPSQIYEAILEGCLLYYIMMFFTKNYKTLNKRKLNSSLFLILYSIKRIFIEYFREPDIQIGYIMNHFTMGQMLSFPMLFIGIYLLLNIKFQST